MAVRVTTLQVNAFVHQALKEVDVKTAAHRATTGMNVISFVQNLVRADIATENLDSVNVCRAILGHRVICRVQILLLEPTVISNVTVMWRTQQSAIQRYGVCESLRMFQYLSVGYSYTNVLLD